MGEIVTPDQGEGSPSAPTFSNWSDPILDAFRAADKALKPIARDLADLEEMRRELWTERRARIAEAMDRIVPQVMGMTIEAEVIKELGDPPTIGIYQRRASSYQVTPYEHVYGDQRGYVQGSGRKFSVTSAVGKVIGADVQNLALVLRRGHFTGEAYVVRLLHPTTGEPLVSYNLKRSKGSDAQDLA